MSDTTKIERTIAGDWRLLAGILAADVTRAGQHPVSRAGSYGVSMTIFAQEPDVDIVAHVLFHGVGGTTLVQVEAPPAGLEHWRQELLFLARSVQFTESYDELTRPRAAEVIETYYRRKAAGGKVTLKVLAEETGYSLAYLKTAKRRYDAAGLWGSKKKS
jgi:hypothetical protein